MIEISRESAKFFATKQIFADQARIILKEGWFSDFEILEIGEQGYLENYERDPSIQTLALNTERQEPSIRTEKQNTENRNTTDAGITKQILSKEDKINVILRRENKCYSKKTKCYPKKTK